MQKRIGSVVFLAGVIILAGGEVRADTITEYFNNYGTANVTLNGLNGPSEGTRQWAGGWDAANITYTSGNTNDGNNLAYNQPGYSNTGNQNGSDDGSVGSVANTNASTSTFGRRVIGGSGFTGTVWLSALAQPNGGTSRFYLNPSATNDQTDYFQLSGTTGGVRYNNTMLTANKTTNATTNQANLFLIRILINGGAGATMGTNDSADYWINPDLSNGMSGIIGSNGQALNSDFTGTGANAFGIDFNSIGVGFSGGINAARLDAIRISNDANGFSFVTGVQPVPEPGTMSMLLLGVVGIIGAAWRRKKQQSTETDFALLAN